MTNTRKKTVFVAVVAASTIRQLTTDATSPSHMVSSSNSRLPMSLSSVINDLEAEGASKVITAAFLTSRGVTRSQRSLLLRTLFHVASSDNGDATTTKNAAADSLTTTTAFGMKMSDEHNTALDNNQEDDDDDDDDHAFVGVAIANPLVDATVTEVAATVQACGGSIVYAASLSDLKRGEGLFDKLGPAVERILNGLEATPDGPHRSKALIVVVTDAVSPEEMQLARLKLESAATSMLSTLVQKSKTPMRATRLSDVFDRVEYVSSNNDNSSSPSQRQLFVDDILCHVRGAPCNPSTAASCVANAVYSSMDAQTTVASLHKSPLELAAVRKLLPAYQSALDLCVNTVLEATNGNGGGQQQPSSMKLIPELGELCRASMNRALSQFDSVASSVLVSQQQQQQHWPVVAKRIRSDLVEEMHAELESIYDIQISLLQQASFESFQRGLSKLRLSPNLASDMARVANETVRSFSSAQKKMRIPGTTALLPQRLTTAATTTVLPSSSVRMVRKQLREYITSRLQDARASGKYRPLPRKGVTLGFHWLLPKPFGNDYRMEPWQVHAMDNLVYAPTNRVTDVDRTSVETGDWRNSIVPAPTGNEMIYFK